MINAHILHNSSQTSMTLRERHLIILRGGVPDRIPWNCYSWLVPQTSAARQLVQKGLGLMGTCRIHREINEDMTVRSDRYVINGSPHDHITIETPVGTLTEDATIESGYGSRWIKKYFIAGEEDYLAAEYFFRHTRFEPNFEPWQDADNKMGEDGFVVAEIMPIPLMTLMVNWMGIERLTEGIFFHTDGLENLLDALDHHYDRQVQLAAESPAEIIWFGDNVTGTIVSPKWFEKYVAPEYKRAVPVLCSAGKIPIAHYDGANRRLADCLARTSLPVIEAFTPPPIGDLPVAEAKAAWPEKVICVNFPGNLFLEPFEAIYTYALHLLEEGAPGGRFVLGCTEDFPQQHFEKTFGAMGKALAEYQGYTWEQNEL